MSDYAITDLVLSKLYPMQNNSFKIIHRTADNMLSSICSRQLGLVFQESAQLSIVLSACFLCFH